MKTVPGLRDVVSTTTRISSVRGEEGRLILAGYPVEELAPNASFEETLFLVWNDRLPTAAERLELHAELTSHRHLDEVTRTVLEAAAARRVAPMDALRMAAATLGLARTTGRSAERDVQRDLARLVAAQFPIIVATYWRLLRGEGPVEPRDDLSHAGNFLYMASGTPPRAGQVRALETYLNTVVDHGMNSSTFTARVIASTGSDLVSAVVGAVGALKGPRHGGAPGPALDMVFEIRQRAQAEGRSIPDQAERWGRAALASGRRLMGFGHRVYRVRDPRADVLAAAADALVESDEERALHRDAREVEAVMLRLLKEHRPGRSLNTNVEFYTALILHDLGLDPAFFPAVFALGRVGGWIGHVFEQYEADELIRPRAAYRGSDDRRWRARTVG